MDRSPPLDRSSPPTERFSPGGPLSKHSSSAGDGRLGIWHGRTSRARAKYHAELGQNRISATSARSLIPIACLILGSAALGWSLLHCIHLYSPEAVASCAVDAAPPCGTRMQLRNSAHLRRHLHQRGAPTCSGFMRCRGLCSSALPAQLLCDPAPVVPAPPVHWVFSPGPTPPRSRRSPG